MIDLSATIDEPGGARPCREPTLTIPVRQVMFALETGGGEVEEPRRDLGVFDPASLPSVAVSRLLPS